MISSFVVKLDSPMPPENVSAVWNTRPHKQICGAPYFPVCTQGAVWNVSIHFIIRTCPSLITNISRLFVKRYEERLQSSDSAPHKPQMLCQGKASSFRLSNKWITRMARRHCSSTASSAAMRWQLVEFSKWAIGYIAWTDFKNNQFSAIFTKAEMAVHSILLTKVERKKSETGCI